MLRDPEVGTRARESVQRIRDEARCLLRLVLNLLDISKSEEGQLMPRRTDVDLDALITDLLAAHEAKAQAAGVTLRRTVEIRTITADVDLLRRVIENLLDNALRHAPERSEVRITAAKREGGFEIRVADTGPGISPEMREKIFERFMQIESGERGVTRTGRGLGLTFCKLAIEAHGGTIWVEEAKPGAVFCVRLP